MNVHRLYHSQAYFEHLYSLSLSHPCCSILLLLLLLLSSIKIATHRFWEMFFFSSRSDDDDEYCDDESITKIRWKIKFNLTTSIFPLWLSLIYIVTSVFCSYCCIYCFSIWFFVLFCVRSLLFCIVEWEKQDNQYVLIQHFSLHSFFFLSSYSFCRCEQCSMNLHFALRFFFPFAHIIVVIGVNRIWLNWSFAA